MIPDLILMPLNINFDFDINVAICIAIARCVLPSKVMQGDGNEHFMMKLNDIGVNSSTVLP